MLWEGATMMYEFTGDVESIRDVSIVSHFVTLISVELTAKCSRVVNLLTRVRTGQDMT